MRHTFTLATAFTFALGVTGAAAQQPPTPHEHGSQSPAVQQQEQKPKAQQQGEAQKTKSDKKDMKRAHKAMNDAEYVQMMKMHHEHGMEMVKLALERSEREEVKKFAHRVLVAQQQDIEELEQIAQSLQPAAVGTSGQGERPAEAHGEHGMHDAHASKDKAAMKDHHSGQMGDQMTKSLENLSGAEFEQKFLQTLQRHHEMAIEMSLPSGQFTSQDVKQFAQELVAAQSDEIKEIQRLQNASR